MAPEKTNESKQTKKIHDDPIFYNPRSRASIERYNAIVGPKILAYQITENPDRVVVNRMHMKINGYDHPPFPDEEIRKKYWEWYKKNCPENLNSWVIEDYIKYYAWIKENAPSVWGDKKMFEGITDFAK